MTQNLYLLSDTAVLPWYNLVDWVGLVPMLSYSYSSYAVSYRSCEFSCKEKWGLVTQTDGELWSFWFWQQFPLWHKSKQQNVQLHGLSILPGLNFDQEEVLCIFFHSEVLGLCKSLWKGAEHSVLSIFSFNRDGLFLLWLQKYLSQLAEESLKMKEEDSHLLQDDTGIVPHFTKKKIWCVWAGRAIMSECWYIF